MSAERPAANVHAYSQTGVHPRERMLRGALLAVPILGLPIPPGVLLGVHALIVLGSVAAGIPAGFVVLFYALWTLGWLIEGDSWASSQRGPALLIGDSDLNVPRPYWPWGARQKFVRRQRHVRALEIACQIPTRDYWYANA